MTLTFDLLTLKVVSESRVTWATSAPILVFLGLSVLDLRLMYATDVRQDRCQTDVGRALSLNAPPGGIKHFQQFHYYFVTIPISNNAANAYVYFLFLSSSIVNDYVSRSSAV